MFGASELRLRSLNPSAAEFSSKVVASVSTERIRRDIEILSRPRSRISHDDMHFCEDYIERQLTEAGWRVRRQAIEYSNVSIVVGVNNGRAFREVRQSVTGTNLIAQLDDDDDMDGATIVGAHFDTVTGSPGADDNGSGIAAILELARVLKGALRIPKVRLIAFDLEEVGLLGSQAIVAASAPGAG